MRLLNRRDRAGSLIGGINTCSEDSGASCCPLGGGLEGVVKPEEGPTSPVTLEFLLHLCGRMIHQCFMKMNLRAAFPKLVLPVKC